jgi:hypothetical protein
MENKNEKDIIFILLRLLFKITMIPKTAAIKPFITAEIAKISLKFIIDIYFTIISIL